MHSVFQCVPVLTEFLAQFLTSSLVFYRNFSALLMTKNDSFCGMEILLCALPILLIIQEISSAVCYFIGFVLLMQLTNLFVVCCSLIVFPMSQTDLVQSSITITNCSFVELQLFFLLVLFLF